MTKIKTAIRYQEGDWFAIPLSGSGYAIGLIARMKSGRGSKAILGYFFGPRFEGIPSLEATRTLSAGQAVDICRFGDLGLHNGSWPLIGRSEHWRREEWPMPVFGRMQLISGVAFEVRYSDDDPGKLLSERKCDPSKIAGLPKDGLSGSGAVESVLSFKLGGAEERG